MIRIAAILTCFNRCEMTLECLESLFSSIDKYNDKTGKDKVCISLYLTDDGCTDGTAERVVANFPDKDIHILRGTGNLYWAGGMRLAWREAQKNNYDFHLLLNNDTTLCEDCIETLFKTHEYCLNTHKSEGVYSGVTASKSDHTTITYGGDVIINKLTGKMKRLEPNGTPQLIDKTNANILLIPVGVVNKIGIFYDGFIHGMADTDYAMMARHKGIPVLITPCVAGYCDNDHLTGEDSRQHLLSMTLAQRKAYFAHPLHSDADRLKFIWRQQTIRWPMAWLFSKLKVYCPKFYLKINSARGI